VFTRRRAESSMVTAPMKLSLIGIKTPSIWTAFVSGSSA
jgi:hypothetical protein